MSKLLVICGPTATGKTALGVYLAKKFNGEIISADSRQVYRGMDIITGKDIPNNSELRIMNYELGIDDSKFEVGYRLKEEIPIWLVDIVEPDYMFNVGEYKILADKVIEDIRGRKLLPIVVGGTGLYIRALATQLDLIKIPPNKLLRKELDKLTREELALRLRKINPKKWEKMNDSDRQNPRRLIRAIEISYVMKKKNVDESMMRNWNRDDVLLIGLTASSKRKLYDLIDKRVEERIQDEAVKETENLFQKRYSPDLSSLTASGYRPLLQYIERTIPFETAKWKWKCVEHIYARRQLRFFCKDKRVRWFDVTMKNYLEDIEAEVRKWYNI